MLVIGLLWFPFVRVSIPFHPTLHSPSYLIVDFDLAAPFLTLVVFILDTVHPTTIQ